MAVIAMNLRCFFTWFEAVSSLRVNLAKSSLLPVGEIDNIQPLLSVGLIKDFWGGKLDTFRMGAV